MMWVDESILFYAFRYALGRKTYAVQDVVENILNNWDNITTHTKTFMKKEIEEAIHEDRAGMSIDIVSWEKILIKED